MFGIILVIFVIAIFFNIHVKKFIAKLQSKEEKITLDEYSLKSATDDEDSDAQSSHRDLYQNKEQKNLDEHSLKLAADSGHADTQYNLGVLYQNQKKLYLAEYYLKLAANDGHPEALKYFRN